MARGLKFRIKKVEESYYLSSENKGVDQLRGYRKADLRLCFRIYAKRWFSHDAAIFFMFVCLVLLKCSIILNPFEYNPIPGQTYQRQF